MAEIPEQPHEKKRHAGNAFSIELGGNKYEFNAKNSELYLYSEMPEADNFFLHGAGRIFRRTMSNFDSMAYFAENNGFTIHPEIYPSDDVYKLYAKTFGAPELPPLAELTPRMEKRMKFAAYLLEREIITPESFNEPL